MIPDSLKRKIFYPGEDHRKSILDVLAPGETLVFTNGCFDLIHPGHIICLLRAKEMGDILVVGLNTDNSIKNLKGPGRPIKGEVSRAMVLAAFHFVDWVVLFDEQTPESLIKSLNPHVLVKGGDYKADDLPGADHVKSTGGRIVCLPYISDYSSTTLINKIKKI